MGWNGTVDLGWIGTVDLGWIGTVSVVDSDWAARCVDFVGGWVSGSAVAGWCDGELVVSWSDGSLGGDGRVLVGIH